jgi:hypothetical protein
VPCHGIADAYFESSLLIVPDILFFGRAEIREMGDRVAVRSQRKWLMVAAALLLCTVAVIAAVAQERSRDSRVLLEEAERSSPVIAVLQELASAPRSHRSAAQVSRMRKDLSRLARDIDAADARRQDGGIDTEGLGMGHTAARDARALLSRHSTAGALRRLDHATSSLLHEWLGGSHKANRARSSHRQDRLRDELAFGIRSYRREEARKEHGNEERRERDFDERRRPDDGDERREDVRVDDRISGRERRRAREGREEEWERARDQRRQGRDQGMRDRYEPEGEVAADFERHGARREEGRWRRNDEVGGNAEEEGGEEGGERLEGGGERRRETDGADEWREGLAGAQRKEEARVQVPCS